MFPRKAVRSRTTTTVVALGCLVLATTTTSTTTQAFSAASSTKVRHSSSSSIHRLYMQPTTTTKQKKKKSTATYAVQVEGTATATPRSTTTTSSNNGNANAYSTSTTFPNNNYNAQSSSFGLQTLASILYASGLVTCNTVGAGMLVLPEVCAGPGMTVSTVLFVVWYVVNLASGSLLAHVAMEQQKQTTSREEAPSSFQEFTKANLQGMEHVIAAVSLIKNALVLAFGTMQAGVVLQQSNIQTLQFVDASFLSIGWAAIFCGLVGTCSASALSQLATVLVVALFGSFAALIVGSGNAMFWNVDFLAHVYALPPTAAADDISASLFHAAPIVLMSFIYQNIVPTVVRMLDYRPAPVYASLTIGSAIPAVMYWIRCVVVLGSADTTGAATASSSMGAMGTLFSLVTIAGSQLGSSTSMAEELDAYLTTTTTSSKENSNKQDDPFSGPAAILPGLGALAIGHVVAQDHLVDLLEYAGAFGSPLLYFVLPVVFWLSQRQQQQEGRQ